MANEYSAEDLLNFLEHTSERGLMPATTVKSLAVASRNVFGILTDEERADVRQLNLDEVVRRFNNKRARDFNPASLKEYDRRVRRAVAMFLDWRADPAGFAPRTRAPTSSRGRDRSNRAENSPLGSPDAESLHTPLPQNSRGYQTSFPVRPGMLITLSNLPSDLTQDEAERFADFVRMLGVIRRASDSSANRGGTE